MQKEDIEVKTHIQNIVNMLQQEEKEHMRRVAGLTSMLSEKAFRLGIYKNDAEWNGYEHFGEAAFYHDIGKAWIPRELLLKNGKLTKQEKLIFQLHPVFARIVYDNIMKGQIFGLPECLYSPAFLSAEYHHERWDGKGYPHGIKNREIPLIARITAICDAYDAITSKRMYKEALSYDFAARELRENAGSQFDPWLTKVFLENGNAFAQL